MSNVDKQLEIEKRKYKKIAKELGYSKEIEQEINACKNIVQIEQIMAQHRKTDLRWGEGGK